jgi:hypothetical protein
LKPTSTPIWPYGIYPVDTSFEWTGFAKVLRGTPLQAVAANPASHVVLDEKQRVHFTEVRGTGKYYPDNSASHPGTLVFKGDICGGRNGLSWSTAKTRIAIRDELIAKWEGSPPFVFVVAEKQACDNTEADYQLAIVKVL